MELRSYYTKKLFYLRTAVVKVIQNISAQEIEKKRHQEEIA